ncbi:hypothetical protein L1987_66221 [Smallanthus sonchifolius]|uniref:Uncharacterized protein n=1 Tax=Smallanthus sonchifolius TaxID=185202 RepID=A0ACB9BWJ1_9ASTR|nr:hypothetical protein L1987_66221 [Smallanthus sonchifolius]
MILLGPVAAEAMFVNREEIPVYPIYRDPVSCFIIVDLTVHDFGFFRYDPAAIQFLSYEEIPLAPEAACVGLEIRVVGNDSGEKVSFLLLMLLLLGPNGCEKAASGTKGGSSGSPVIDCQGRAVALNAGGERSSSSSAFFFPLERGRDSCQDKWEAVTIPRGTVQATFVHKGFDETRRLGLQSETEQVCSFYSTLLIVDSVVSLSISVVKLLSTGSAVCLWLPSSWACCRCQVITQFLKMETLLDDSVGQNVELEFERGGTSLTVQLVVEDLHTITPNYFLEVSSAVMHPLSYQQARNFRFHCGLVYVSEPGSYMLYRAGVPRHAIIKRLADEDISNLEDFINVLSKLSRGARVPLVYINYNGRHRKMSVLVTVDRHEWYASPQIYTRDDGSGIWIGKPALLPNSQLISSGAIQVGNGVASMDTSTSEHVQEESNNGTKKRRLGEEDASADGTMIAEVEDSTSPGNTVMSDDHDTSADSGNASVAERVIEPTLVMLTAVFLHPVHNYAVIAYDPSALGPAEPALRRGESVYLVGLSSRSLQATSRKSVVTNPCAALQISSAESPRYRETNMEVIELDTDFGSSFSGVLTDEHGRVKAIWASFSFQLKYGLNSSQNHQCVRGIPVHSVSQVLNKIISGTKGPSRIINGIKRPMPLVRVLEVEFYCTLLSKARSFGLSNNWIQALAKKDPVRRQVLQVNGCLAGSKAENLLEQGDMVLAIDKNPVTCFNDLEDACHALDMHDDMDAKLELTIFRQGSEMEICVGTDVRDGNGTTRVINWCGCFVQDPHPAVRALGFLPQEGHGVYVTRYGFDPFLQNCSLDLQSASLGTLKNLVSCRGSIGSPVHRYGLYPHRWIVEVNGKPTPDLDAFVNVTKEIEDGEFVRVRTVHFNGKPEVLTLKQDLHYWPTWELSFDPETAIWHRKTIKSIETGDSL